MGWYSSVMPQKCPQKYSQACYHYRSDRDGWPPRYFWPGDIVAAAKGLKQSFCNKNGAQVTKVNTDKGLKTMVRNSYKNSKWIRTIGTAVVDKPLIVRKTTNWHGLKENRCWPKALASEDPGWVLLTDDEFYTDQHPTLAKLTDRYKNFPDLALLRAGLLKRDPVNIFRGYDAVKALQEFGETGVPLEFQGVLPGVPKFSTPKPPRRIRGLPFNWRIATGPPEEAVDGPLLEGGEIEPDEMNDEELFEWMQNFAEDDWELNWEDDTPTAPNEVEAIPTPTGQGDATATPVLAGISPYAGWAAATGFIS
ncbi:hypothetical protein IFR05_007786 [Cadophora sp. M221]|nr:hypothetical protein IFR05_007786 [Cadophora sp. M221]